MNKENITTYLNGILLAIFSYAGISQTTTDLYIQIFAPIISISIASIVSYYNEKYPSSYITNVKIEEEDDGL